MIRQPYLQPVQVQQALQQQEPLAQELAERAAVAGMLGEVDGRIDGLRRVLLVEQTDSNS